MVVKKILDPENKFYRRIRKTGLKPLVYSLDKMGITANGITNFRLVAAIVFILTFNYFRIFSFVLITATILLDLVDGPLARYTKKTSDRGKFLDIFVDGIVYFVFVLSFLYLGVEPVFVVGYLGIVNFTYLLAVIWKNEDRKSDWIIHANANSAHLKFLVVFAFYLFFVFHYDYLELSLVVSSIFSIIAFVYYYVRLQMRWAKKS